jgi:hypothetical protein
MQPVHCHKNLSLIIVYRVVTFLGNGRETNNGTIPVTKQRILNKATDGLQQCKSCVSYVVRAEGL